MERSLAELLGTFALVIAGSGAIVVNDLYGGVPTHVGIALTLGMVIMTMVFAVGDGSGASESVTIAFGLAGRLPRRWLAPFLAAQTASAFLAWSFPQHPTLGATVPTLGVVPTLAFEVLLA